MRMNPVKLLNQPGAAHFICLRDLSNLRNHFNLNGTSSFNRENEDEGGGGGGEETAEEEEEVRKEREKEKDRCNNSPSSSSAVTPVGLSPPSHHPLTPAAAATDDIQNGKDSSSKKLKINSISLSSSSSSSDRTPSPLMNQQVAVTSTAAEDTTMSSPSPLKQLNKLKRFLKTIHHLGSDISTDIGELVRNLVLALVHKTISIETFHEKLHKTTNFPLRPFVIPFLKSSLPILHQELENEAQLNRLSPHQYLAKNEHLLFDVDDRVSRCLTTIGGKCNSSSANTDNDDDQSEKIHRKRKSYVTDGKEETKINSERDRDSYRCVTDSNPNHKRSRMKSPMTTNGYPTESLFVRLDGCLGARPILLQDTIGSSRLMTADQIEKDQEQRDRERYFANYNCSNFYLDSFDQHEDDWKHIDHILQSIVGLVDKCQRVLLVLQQRSQHNRVDMTTRMIRRTVDEIDIKRYVTDFLSRDVHQTEEQRLDSLRKAVSDANDFRLHSIIEGVSSSESDRLKMDENLEEIRRKTRDELNRQEDSDENCWNCGRIASQTCSGCNVARYCGEFCQHRHWENHRRSCGKKLHDSAAHTSSSSSSTSSSSSSVLTRFIFSNEEFLATNSMTESVTKGRGREGGGGRTIGDVAVNGMLSETDHRHLPPPHHHHHQQQQQQHLPRPPPSIRNRLSLSSTSTSPVLSLAAIKQEQEQIF